MASTSLFRPTPKLLLICLAHFALASSRLQERLIVAVGFRPTLITIPRGYRHTIERLVAHPLFSDLAAVAGELGILRRWKVYLHRRIALSESESVIQSPCSPVLRYIPDPYRVPSALNPLTGLRPLFRLAPPPPFPGSQRSRSGR